MPRTWDKKGKLEIQIATNQGKSILQEPGQGHQKGKHLQKRQVIDVIAANHQEVKGQESKNWRNQ